jgi:hypothetical protein
MLSIETLRFVGRAPTATERSSTFPTSQERPLATIEHWAARARSLKHPFLKARYADLTWEMSGLIGKRRRETNYTSSSILKQLAENA